MKVSIIIPTYFINEDSQKYLDLCLESIENLNYPKYLLDIIVVSSGIKPVVRSIYRHIHSDERMHFPKAANLGIKNAKADSELYFILNDDTCCTTNSLKNMVEMMGKNRMILNPISNCDNTVRYGLVMGYVKDGQFQEVRNRFYRLADFKGDQRLLMRTESIYPHGMIAQEWVAFYATLIPKSVWLEVGGLDENYLTGQDDLDFSMRCKKLNIPRGVVLNALIWHFGGVTSSEALDTETRIKNINYYKGKWGRLPDS
jgi:GT2 family glycosyltransferase